MMFGQVVPGLELAAQIECACENLEWAAPYAADSSVLLLLEPLNQIDFPHYALNRTSTAVKIVEAVNDPQVKLLYDVYHAQMTEGNLINTINTHIPLIGHIQIADVPGRHEPGTGEINFPAIFATLEELQYTGFVGLEYRPSSETNESLSWLPVADRA
jgi:hydroxypyruvate isomerase